MFILQRRFSRPLQPLLFPFNLRSSISIRTIKSQTSYDPISTHHPLLTALPNSSSLAQIQRLHSKFIVSGLTHHPFVASKLIQALVSLSCQDYADFILSTTPHPTLFTYNILIRAHSISPTHVLNSSFLLFRRLLEDHSRVTPNQYTLAFVLNSCCYRQGMVADEELRSIAVFEADQIRGQGVRLGLDSNLFVCNVAIRVYGSWAMMEEAERVFKDCSSRDLFSWNSMIGGYVNVGDMKHAMMLFEEMPNRDVVSWSTVISGFVQEGSFMEAMELFHQMQRSGVTPNEVTFTCILTASANLVALDQGRWIHSYIKKAKIGVNERLLSSLIDMYAKCGEIVAALKTFNDGFLKMTVYPWNAMLNGFAIHGMAEDAIDLFEKMRSEGIAPNKVTFISLLSACSHGNFLDEANAYFESMSAVYWVHPEIEHYGCMVDLFGRAGLLNKAEKFISLMPMPPDFIIWSSLLNACRIHRDVARAERVGRIIKELNPEQAGCQVLLANIYSRSGKWAGARKVRNEVEVFRPRKIPGWSSIELGGIFHQFLVGDKSHPQTKEIYLFLDELSIKLKRAGYEPELEEVLVDVDEEDKETALGMHSEKLAIAFGLMNTAPGTVIRVVKNLRVCIDCHQATKLISKLYSRDIIVRDRVRFHYFKDGSCSCKDYW
ncbi:pentatricopeptide repeat-containing protein At3g62890-like [Wolffia australiana]